MILCYFLYKYINEENTQFWKQRFNDYISYNFQLFTDIKASKRCLRYTILYMGTGEDDDVLLNHCIVDTKVFAVKI